MHVFGSVVCGTQKELFIVDVQCFQKADSVKFVCAQVKTENENEKNNNN